MPIVITTTEDGIAESLENSAPDGVRVLISYPEALPGGRMTRNAHVITATIHFLTEHGGNVVDGLFASWLYDVIKNKSCRILHRGKDVVPDEISIRRMIQDEFDFEKSQQQHGDHDA